MLRRLSWTNSTGSSIVTILARRLWLIEVDHEVERGRLAHARRARQQDQAVGQAAQFFDHGRKPQFGGRADRLFAQPNGQLGTAGVKIDAGAKAAHSFRVPREAKLQPLLENLALLGQQHFVDQLAQRRFIQRLPLADVNFAVDPQTRRQRRESGECRWPRGSERLPESVRVSKPLNIISRVAGAARGGQSPKEREPALFHLPNRK